MDNLVVVVDADAIIAQVYLSDSNHLLAVKIAAMLDLLKAKIIYPASTISEAITVLQTKLNSGATAYDTILTLTSPNVQIAEIDKTTLKNATRYFSPTTSKKNTLFDCIVAAVAEEYKADAIFSFDRFYKTKGFKLAGELKSTSRKNAQDF